LEEGRSDTIVATARFVREDVSAAAEARTVRSGSLGGDGRWPQIGSKVARLGVHSAVTLPLATETGCSGQ
jgi:hypothetical protein